MVRCGYCDESFSDEDQLTDHLIKQHEWENLSRIDQKRIETSRPGKTPNASLSERLQSIPYSEMLTRRRTIGVSAGLVGLATAGVIAQNPFGDTTVDTTPYEGQWDVGPTVPHEAEYPAVVGYDGELYLFGGGTQDEKTPQNDAVKYNPETDSWSQLASMPVDGQRMSASVVDDRIYVIDGMSQAAGHGEAAVRIYDPDSDSWSTGTDRPIGARDPGQATDGEKIYLFGGNAFGQSITQSQVYDPQTDSWEEIRELPFVNRQMSCHYVPEQEKVYLFGGEHPEGPPQRTDVITYDPETDSYDDSPTDMPQPSQTIPSTVYDGKVFFAGGEDKDGGGRVRTFRIYDPEIDAWGKLPELTYRAEGTDAAVVDNQLFVPGGRQEVDDGRPFDMMQIYTFSS